MKQRARPAPARGCGCCWTGGVECVVSRASNISGKRLSNWICGLCGHELTSLAIYLHDGLVYIFSWLVCIHGRPPLAGTAHAQQTQNV